MKIILLMAMSANGMIARENGDEDFLSEINWKVFCKLAKDIGCFVIGRKTYEAVQKWENYNFDDVHAKRIVISRNTKLKLGENYLLASSPKDAISKATGFSKLLLTGGSIINTAFMKQQLVDEIILNVEPFVLGKGIRLFAEDSFETKLKLLKTKKLAHGIIQLHYKVLK